MELLLKLSLPKELINTILSFDKHFRIDRGIPISIISKDDSRYTVVKSICRFSSFLDIIDFDGIRITQRFYLSRPLISVKNLHAQDQIFVVISERKKEISYFIEHTRINNKKKHLYYGYHL
jgi:vancomycin permeability regulator SanA